jgi:etoposide-induced 2.4 mRNA
MQSSNYGELSLLETLRLHLTFFRKGLSDATRWRSTLRTIEGNAVLRANIVKSVVPQLILLGSALVFDWVRVL